MAPYTEGAIGDYDDDYYDLSSLFVPVLLDKPKDVTIVLPSFILEDIASDVQEVRGSIVPIHEGDSQVSEIYDDDDFPQVDAELHKFVEQKLSGIADDHLANLSFGDESDFTDVIVPIIAPVAMIGGGELFREVVSSDWQMPEVNISGLLRAIPESVVFEEEIEVITIQPVGHNEEVSAEGDTVGVTTVVPVISSVMIVDLPGSNEGDSELNPIMAEPVVVTGDVQTEKSELVIEQLKAEVTTDSVIEQVKILHDEEVIISNGEGSDKVRVTLTQKWMNPQSLVVRVNNESIPVISATIVIQDGVSGHAKIGDEVTEVTEVIGVNLQEYVGPPEAHERLPRYDLESDTPTLIGVTGEVLSHEGDDSVLEPEVRARDADSILGALILIGVLLGNNNS